MSQHTGGTGWIRLDEGWIYGDRLMSEELVLWHDFNVALVTAAAGLLGLLFVALSIHIRALTDRRNAELRSVARSIFLGYVVSLGFGFLALMPQTLEALGLELLALDVAASIPFGAAARSGLRATGVGFDRRVTMVQFVAGFGLFAIAIASSVGVALGQPPALYVAAGIAIVALLWGVFNTWELIFRMQNVGGQSA
jgi:FtsH-binding integral membrane protein